MRHPLRPVLGIDWLSFPSISFFIPGDNWTNSSSSINGNGEYISKGGGGYEYWRGLFSSFSSHMMIPPIAEMMMALLPILFAPRYGRIECILFILMDSCYFCWQHKRFVVVLGDDDRSQMPHHLIRKNRVPLTRWAFFQGSHYYIPRVGFHE